MSASSKKKLRKEQATAGLTEKQLAAQKEAKKLKVYTITFVAVMVLILLFAVGTLAYRSITSSGYLEKNTTAATVGTHNLSNAQLSYYYVDAINNMYNNYYNAYSSSAATYLQMLMGLDLTQPLSSQSYPGAEEGQTWADYFVDTAIDNAKSAYAIYDAAMANGYTVTEEDQASVERTVSSLNLYASYSGYPSAEAYLKASYGNGATLDSYREYLTVNTVALSYQNVYNDSLSYDDSDVQAYNAEHEIDYNSYSFAYYYVSSNNFLEGGTKNEDGTTTYSDEERQAAAAAAKEVADSLLDAESVEDLDALISALPMNAENESAASTKNNNVFYNNISTTLRDWITASGRKEGNMTVIPSETTSTDDDGNTKTTINGYYTVYFVDSSENNMPLVNVRHILVSNSTSDEGPTAQETAEALLEEWKSGNATEDTFAALATEHSVDTGSASNGGLYEDVYPGQMVTAFNDWCFDESRKPGDTGIVETDYGYHVMYFVGNSDTTYREYLIRNQLRNDDMNAWYDALLENMTVTNGNTAYINRDMVYMSTSLY